MCSAICFSLDQSKFLLSGNGLTVEIKFIKGVLKNVIKRASGELNNFFQDEFHEIFISTVNECQILFIT